MYLSYKIQVVFNFIYFVAEGVAMENSCYVIIAFKKEEIEIEIEIKCFKVLQLL